MRFRLLRGTHQAKTKDGKLVLHKATDRKTNVVKSDTDLVKKFGPEKFARIDGGRAAEYEDEVEPEGTTAEGEITEDDELGLSAMTVPELKKFAAESSIDLGGATKKDEIVAKLREALADKE